MPQGYFLIPFQLEIAVRNGERIPHRFTDLTSDLEYVDRDTEEVGVRNPDLPYGGVVALIETETQAQLETLAKEHPAWQSLTRMEASALLSLLSPHKPRRDRDGSLKIDGGLWQEKRAVRDLESNLARRKVERDGRA